MWGKFPQVIRHTLATRPRVLYSVKRDNRLAKRPASTFGISVAFDLGSSCGAVRNREVFAPWVTGHGAPVGGKMDRLQDIYRCVLASHQGYFSPRFSPRGLLGMTVTNLLAVSILMHPQN